MGIVNSSSCPCSCLLKTRSQKSMGMVGSGFGVWFGVFGQAPDLYIFLIKKRGRLILHSFIHVLNPSHRQMVHDDC
jgi:hypothetical protein